MKLMRIIPLLLMSANLWADPAEAWRYAPPSPESFTAMNWPKVLNSPFRDLLRAEIPTQTLAVMNGLNFIEGIDAVVVSRSGPELLVVLTGNFDLGRIRDMAISDGGTVKQYKKADLLLSADADSQVALVNSGVVLLGNRDAITQAIDRAAMKPGKPPVSHDLWIFSKSPSPEIDRTSITFDLLNAGVRFNADISARTPELAQKIQDNARLLDLVSTQSGNDLHITGQLGRNEFARRPGQWRITLEQLAAVHPVDTPETPPKPVQGTIRIVGLDDTVHEVPLGPQAPGTTTSK